MIKPLLDTLNFTKMSDEEYFSEKYKDYVSNSKLNKINPEQEGSFEKYLENKPLKTNSLELGSAIHEMILQKDEFELIYDLDKPTSKLGEVADNLYSIYIHKKIEDKDIIKVCEKVDYFKNSLTSNRLSTIRESCSSYWKKRFEYENNNFEKLSIITPIYLDDKTGEKANICIGMLERNYNIMSIINPENAESLNEFACFIEFDINIENKGVYRLKFKSKFDNLVIDKKNNKVVLNDLKTTFKNVSDFDQSFEYYHYYRQMGVYGYLALLVSEKFFEMRNAELEGNMLLVSTSDYSTGIFKVKKEDFIRGFEEFKKLIINVAEHMI